MGIEWKHIGDNKAPLLPSPPTQKKKFMSSFLIVHMKIMIQKLCVTLSGSGISKYKYKIVYIDFKSYETIIVPWPF
jgi:hypothetical protein